MTSVICQAFGATPYTTFGTGTAACSQQGPDSNGAQATATAVEAVQYPAADGQSFWLSQTASSFAKNVSDPANPGGSTASAICNTLVALTTDTTDTDDTSGTLVFYLQVEISQPPAGVATANVQVGDWFSQTLNSSQTLGPHSIPADLGSTFTVSCISSLLSSPDYNDGSSGGTISTTLTLGFLDSNSDPVGILLTSQESGD